MEGNGLSANQKSECTLQPDAALAIAEGALYGLQECSRQLSNRRWNCSYANPLFNNGLQESKLRNLLVNYSYNSYAWQNKYGDSMFYAAASISNVAGFYIIVISGFCCDRDNKELFNHIHTL